MNRNTSGRTCASPDTIDISPEGIVAAVARSREKWARAAAALVEFTTFFRDQMAAADSSFDALVERYGGGSPGRGEETVDAESLVAPLVAASKYDLSGYVLSAECIGERDGDAMVAVRFDSRDGRTSFGFNLGIPHEFDKALAVFDGKVGDVVGSGMVDGIPVRDAPPKSGAGPSNRFIIFSRESPPKDWAVKKAFAEFSRYEVNPSRVQVKYGGYDHGKLKYVFTVYEKPRKHYRKGEERKSKAYLVRFLAREYSCEKVAGRFDKLIAGSGFKFKTRSTRP